MSERERHLSPIIQGCLRGDRTSQRMLYEHFYGYALKVCLCYAPDREEAVEILNDAFLKVLGNIRKYNPELPFKAWLRRILVNSAIDYHRKNHKGPLFTALSAASHVADEELPMPEISPNEDLLPILQQLPPAYRLVFNLYVIEEYKHHEIAEMLHISVSTSRSNLMRATRILREIMTPKQEPLPAKTENGKVFRYIP